MNLEIMYMSTYLLFHGVLRIADYYTRGRSFLLKICSVNEWLKLALWFLTKLGRLLSKYTDCSKAGFSYFTTLCD